MKKKVMLGFVLFSAAFILTYFITSFCVPGWRVKLAADAVTVFIENLKTLMPIKAIISLVVGVIAGSIPFWTSLKETV